MTIVKQGDSAPKFVLRDQTGEKVDSKDLKGKVLLAFHPLAFTSLCTDQMRDLENAYEDFEKLGVTPFGISVDAHPSKGVWAKSIGLGKLKILADFEPKGDLAKQCGVYIDKAGISGRAVVVYEGDAVIWSKQYEQDERPDVDEILSALR